MDKCNIQGINIMLTLSIEKGKYVRRIKMIRDGFYVEYTRGDFVYVGKPRP